VKHHLPEKPAVPRIAMVRRLPWDWEKDVFSSVCSGLEDGLTSEISALKSRREPPIVSCRKTVPGYRKQPEGKTGGRLQKKSASWQGCREKTNPPKGVTQGRSQ